MLGVWAFILCATLLAWRAQAAWMNCTHRGSMGAAATLSVGQAICSPDGTVQLALAHKRLKLTWIDNRFNRPYTVNVWTMRWELLGYTGTATHADVSNGNLCVHEQYHGRAHPLWCTNTTGSGARAVKVDNMLWFGLVRADTANSVVVWRAPGVPPPSPPHPPLDLAGRLRVQWNAVKEKHILDDNCLYSHAPLQMFPRARSRLGPNERTRANSAGVYLQYQNDGNIVLVKQLAGGRNEVLWAAGTSTPKPLEFRMQLDGNVVAYDEEKGAYWVAEGIKPDLNFQYLLVVENDHWKVIRSYDRANLTAPVILTTVPKGFKTGPL